MIDDSLNSIKIEKMWVKYVFVWNEYLDHGRDIIEQKHDDVNNNQSMKVSSFDIESSAQADHDTLSIWKV
jgi:delta-aminolevulinic acid dehydratase/porphobilinogen synthase